MILAIREGNTCLEGDLKVTENELILETYGLRIYKGINKEL